MNDLGRFELNPVSFSSSFSSLSEVLQRRHRVCIIDIKAASACAFSDTEKAHGSYCNLCKVIKIHEV